MNRNRLYIYLSTACITGYAWLAFSYFRSESLQSDPGVCLFRHLTGIPCPSCGSTRAALSLLHGDLLNSIMWNPFGIILMLILFILPIWILYDMVNKVSSLHKFYNKAELYLSRKYIAIPLILIALVNWVWNIAKGL